MKLNSLKSKMQLNKLVKLLNSNNNSNNSSSKTKTISNQTYNSTSVYLTKEQETGLIRSLALCLIFVLRKLFHSAGIFHLFIKWSISCQNSCPGCNHIDQSTYQWMTCKAAFFIEIGKYQPCDDAQYNARPDKNSCKDKKLLKIAPQNSSHPPVDIY
jgi:hypothetical protein